MQDNIEENDFFNLGGPPLTSDQLEELERLKKEITNYKPISWQGRAEICDKCASKVQIAPTVNVCDECGCLLIIKQMIPLTDCPLGKW